MENPHEDDEEADEEVDEPLDEQNHQSSSIEKLKEEQRESDQVTSKNGARSENSLNEDQIADALSQDDQMNNEEEKLEEEVVKVEETQDDVSMTGLNRLPQAVNVFNSGNIGIGLNVSA